MVAEPHTLPLEAMVVGDASFRRELKSTMDVLTTVGYHPIGSALGAAGSRVRCQSTVDMRPGAGRSGCHRHRGGARFRLQVMIDPDVRIIEDCSAARPSISSRDSAGRGQLREGSSLRQLLKVRGGTVGMHRSGSCGATRG